MTDLSQRITLTLNGQKMTLSHPMSLQQALNLWGYQEMSFAVACNGDFVPRGSYLHMMIKPQDDIEIVAPIQGG